MGPLIRTLIKRLAWIVPLALIGTVALYLIALSIPKRDYFLERAGSLVEQTTVEASEDVSIDETLALVSSSGLEVAMRVRRPVDSDGSLPVLLVLGGENTGKDAVDLGGVPEGVAYAAIDYPYRGDRNLKGLWRTAGALPDIRRAFLDTPPALSLAISWLTQQDWVDTRRIELVGVSLGVPFAAVCGALDKRLSRVWLLHGGADNLEWIDHAGRDDIPNDTLRRWIARALLLSMRGSSFETTRWIPEIAPRPLVIVAAKDDDFVPREAIEPFIAAAEGEHVELIWTEGLHINPARPNELQQLLDIVLRRVATP